MNDGLTDLFSDTDSGADLGEAPGFSETDNTASDTQQDFPASDSSVSDTVGSSDLLPSDTEDTETDFDVSETEDTEASSDGSSDFLSEDITNSESMDYLSELEYIDFLLNTQIDEMNAVQTVSGNSVRISFDDTTNQTLQDMRQSQLDLLDNQNAIINLLSCVLLCVVLDFLIASARRTAKKMHGRKE